MKKMNKGILLSIGLTLLSATAQADTEDRSGLLLGIGLGSSSSNISMQSATNGASDPASVIDENGAAISLRLGGAVGNKGALYFLSQANALESELGFGLTGIGASYYFSKTGLSLYVTGGAGVGTVSYANAELPEGTGSAFMGGVGLELGMGLSVELNHMRVNTKPGTNMQVANPDVDYNIASTQFMVGYTWF